MTMSEQPAEPVEKVLKAQVIIDFYNTGTEHEVTHLAEGVPLREVAKQVYKVARILENESRKKPKKPKKEGDDDE